MNQPRFAGNSDQFSRQVYRVLKVADFVDEFFLLGISSGEYATVCQSADVLNIHMATARHRFDELNIHVINDGLEIGLFAFGQRASAGTRVLEFATLEHGFL